MTFFSTTKSSLSQADVRHNFETLSKIKVGDKLVIRNGRLYIENRVLLTSARRYIEGAFDPSVIEQTFKMAMEIRKDANRFAKTYQARTVFYETSLSVLSYTENALKGVSVLSETYLNESKPYVADQLTKIADAYTKIFGVGPAQSSSSSSASAPKVRIESKKVSQIRSFWQGMSSGTAAAPAVRTRAVKKDSPTEEPVTKTIHRMINPKSPSKEKSPCKVVTFENEETLKVEKKPLGRSRRLVVPGKTLFDQITAIFSGGLFSAAPDIDERVAEGKKAKQSDNATKAFNTKLLKMHEPRSCGPASLEDDDEWEIIDREYTERQGPLESVPKKTLLVRSISEQTGLSQIQKLETKKVSFTPNVYDKKFLEVLKARRACTAEYSSDSGSESDPEDDF